MYLFFIGTVLVHRNHVIGIFVMPKNIRLAILLYSCKETKHVWNNNFYRALGNEKENEYSERERNGDRETAVYNCIKCNVQCI